MMYLNVLWSFIGKAKLRLTALVLLCSLTFFTYGVLDSLGDSMFGDAESEGGARLITTHASGLTEFLPYAYIDRVKDIEGVDLVGHHTWFGGYQRSEDQFLIFAVDAGIWLAQRPNLHISQDHERNFQNNRNGLLVTRSLAARYGWKAGDIVSMKSVIYQMKSGAELWEFVVAGYFDPTIDEGGRNYMVMHYDYLDENRMFLNGTVGSIVTTGKKGVDINSLAQRIDLKFVSGENQTRTMTDQQFHTEFFKQFGDISVVLKSVITTSLVSLGIIFVSTIALLLQQRRKDFAILSVNGFTRGELTGLSAGMVLSVLLSGTVLGYSLILLFNRVLINYLPATMPVLSVDLSYFSGVLAISAVFATVVLMLPTVKLTRNNLRGVLSSDG